MGCWWNGRHSLTIDGLGDNSPPTTTLTSVAAMMPLLVFPDEGHFWLGLAVTVVGGLLASTLLAPLASVAMVSSYRK